jgi:iron complex transport system ATP-binding protein
VILNIRGVELGYHSRPVLKDISFHVQRGEILAILGPNGVGKTTLLRCLNALLRPHLGTIIVDGQDLTGLSLADIARMMAYVPQRQEAGRITVFDAVLLGRRPHIRWDVSHRDMMAAQAALQRLRLDALSMRYIDELSGGELQKVAIARALVQEPKVLLLDEPTSSLDLRNQMDILDLVAGIVQEHQISAIFTMHDINMALRYAHKFVFLKSGTIVHAGGPETISKEVIQSVYGVEVSMERYNGYRIVVPLK